MNPAQAKAIEAIKAEIVRVRSYGKPKHYEFKKFEVEEGKFVDWVSQTPTSAVMLSTEYGMIGDEGEMAPRELQGLYYRDHREFYIGPRGGVELNFAHTWEGKFSPGYMVSGVLRSVVWPSRKRRKGP